MYGAWNWTKSFSASSLSWTVALLQLQLNLWVHLLLVVTPVDTIPCLHFYPGSSAREIKHLFLGALYCGWALLPGLQYIFNTSFQSWQPRKLEWWTGREEIITKYRGINLPSILIPLLEAGTWLFSSPVAVKKASPNQRHSCCLMMMMVMISVVQ